MYVHCGNFIQKFIQHAKVHYINGKPNADFYSQLPKVIHGSVPHDATVETVEYDGAATTILVWIPSSLIVYPEGNLENVNTTCSGVCVLLGVWQLFVENVLLSAHAVILHVFCPVQLPDVKVKCLSKKKMLKTLSSSIDQRAMSHLNELFIDNTL